MNNHNMGFEITFNIIYIKLYIIYLISSVFIGFRKKAGRTECKTSSAVHNQHVARSKCSKLRLKQRQSHKQGLKELGLCHKLWYSMIPISLQPNVVDLRYKVSQETWQYAGRLECRLDLLYNLLRLFVNLILEVNF